MNNFIYSKLFIFNIKYEETIYLNFKMLFKSKKFAGRNCKYRFFPKFQKQN